MDLGCAFARARLYQEVEHVTWSGTVSAPCDGDRAEWEGLYRRYADFYEVPMTAEILSEVWAGPRPGEAVPCTVGKGR